MLKIEKLSKAYTTVSNPILSSLDLVVASGQSVSIQGASGCGKSTLLSLIAGFDSPTSGSVMINDYCLRSAKDGHKSDNSKGASLQSKYVDEFRKNELGIVFQSYNLFDCFNAWDNIAFTARLKGNYNKHYQTKLMQQLNILQLAKKPISQLSGGEQQRCAIARALVHQPSLVLADEPTGNLDEATSQAVSDILFDVCRKMNTTLLVVTHSADVAQKADNPLWLHAGQLYIDKALTTPWSQSP